MIVERARRAIESSDTDSLLHVVDDLCVARDWEGLQGLRLACEEAGGRGKQLWGVVEHIRYRFALEAPGDWAGRILDEGEARHILGPLPEVAAARHQWMELEPHLSHEPVRAMTAHERVVRGEDLTGAAIDPQVLELPLRLQPWEPGYPTALYHPDRLEAPSPPAPTMEWIELPAAVDEADDAWGCAALTALVGVWVEQSNGRAQVACVRGTGAHALRALGVTRALVSRLSPAAALAWMGWAGASGGAHGRRRGAAAGRFAAWWTAAALAGLEFPVDPSALGEAVSRLSWHLWSDLSPETGWVIRLAAEDPEREMAWALSANDQT